MFTRQPQHLLTVANQAVVGFSKVRDLIFTNLAQIPLALETARDFLLANNVHQSLKLHQAFSRLCAAIFVAFEDMLRWLQESRFKHAAKSFFLPDGYEAQLQEKMAAVKLQSEDVRQQAEICSHVVLGNVDRKLTKREQRCYFYD